VLNLIKHYAMRAYGGVDVSIHIFLTSALLGGEWSASRPGRFIPGKELPVPIVQEVGWTPGPVWTTWRSNNSWPYRDSNLNLSVVQPVASRYTDCAIPAILLFIKRRFLFLRASDCTTVGKKWIGKDVKEGCPSLFYRRIYLEGRKVTMKNLSQDAHCSDRDSNLPI
jgi:hypothetical protein